jgi:signal transduction histidine kinase
LASGLFDNNLREHVGRLQQSAQPSGCRELERLTSIEHRLSQHYFRLVEAYRLLYSRTSRAPKTSGTLLADALETKRQRLGRELHTGVGQSLAGIYVHVNLIETSLPDPPAPVRTSLDRIASLASDALEQVRGVSRQLYVPAWQAQTLSDALRNLWETSGIPEKFSATLSLQEISPEPPPEVRRALYLAAQEGISNVIQHANATRARLSLCQENSRITLTVADNGSGFRPPAIAPTAAAGIGLRSLRDLAHELGGDLETIGGPQGATLIISFPVIHE